MICTGTGSAPMRAMTERRRRRIALKEGGELMLFFGARAPEELPYFGPLMKLPREFIDINLAFSRVPGQPKQYVQDLIRARARRRRRACCRTTQCFVYVCGLKGMEEGVTRGVPRRLPPARAATGTRCCRRCASRVAITSRRTERPCDALRRPRAGPRDRSSVRLPLTEREIVDFARAYDPQWFHTDPERAARHAVAGPHRERLADLRHRDADRGRPRSSPDRSRSASPGLAYLKWENPVRAGDVLRVDRRSARAPRRAEQAHARHRALALADDATSAASPCSISRRRASSTSLPSGLSASARA